MKRIFSSLNKRHQNDHRPDPSQQHPHQDESQEAIMDREARIFCESGAPDSPSAGDEFLHLPAIVDAAESSPRAAEEGAKMIYRYFGKTFTNAPYAQYNAVMLMRILTDHPGRPFTRHIDAAFVKAVKELLRSSRDASVQQMLRETLDTFAAEKSHDDTLGPLLEMWRKEKAKTKTSKNAPVSGNPKSGQQAGSVPHAASQRLSQPGNHFARPHRQPRSLPSPEELVARIEEARTTAKLLSQTVQSTPNAELIGNELIKEFADRAASASRSMQGYINTTNPAPDEDTMLTLIEVNDQLSFAMSKHQRALLQARKNSGPAAASGPPSQPVGDHPGSEEPPVPPKDGPAGSEPAWATAPVPPERSPRRLLTPPLHPPTASQAQVDREWQRSSQPGPENPFADDAHQPGVSSPALGLVDRELPPIEPLQPRTSPKQSPLYQPHLSYPAPTSSREESAQVHRTEGAVSPPRPSAPMAP